MCSNRKKCATSEGHRSVVHRGVGANNPHVALPNDAMMVTNKWRAALYHETHCLPEISFLEGKRIHQINLRLHQAGHDT